MLLKDAVLSGFGLQGGNCTVFDGFSAFAPSVRNFSYDDQLGPDFRLNDVESFVTSGIDITSTLNCNENPM